MYGGAPLPPKAAITRHTFLPLFSRSLLGTPLLLTAIHARSQSTIGKNADYGIEIDFFHID